MKSQLFFALVMLGLAACSSRPKDQFEPTLTPNVPQREVSSVVDKKVTASNGPTGAQIELTKAVKAACEDSSVLKLPKNEVAAICACVVRNHKGASELDLRSLLRSYKAGKKKLKPVSHDESLLWEYDLELAANCVENTAYSVDAEDGE